MRRELPALPVEREYGQNPLATREAMQRRYRYTKLLRTAVRESTDPLLLDRNRPFRLAPNRRVRVMTESYGGTSVMNFGETTISVGYRDPWLNKGVLILKNEFNPQYGIRFGDSDNVAHTHEQIAEQLRRLETKYNADAKDVIAPVLFELARQQGRLSQETIKDAVDMEAVTEMNMISNDGTDRVRYIYLADPGSNKMICVTSVVPSEMGASALVDIAGVQKFLAAPATQKRLATVSDQAVDIMIDEANKPRIIGEELSDSALFEPIVGKVFTLADLGNSVDIERHMHFQEYLILLRQAIEAAQVRAKARGEKVDYKTIRKDFKLIKLRDGRIVPLLFAHKTEE